MNNKIISSLWLEDKSLETLEFYTSVFPESAITEVYPMVVTAKLFGVPFIAINGRPADIKPNSSISFMVVCETRDEIDAMWKKLSGKGKVYMKLDSYPWSAYYGWIGDQYGVTWQLYLGKLEDVNQQRMVPTLMFSNTQQSNCEKAIHFYQSVFKSFQSHGIRHYEDGPYKGQVMHAQFIIEDFVMAAMDSGVPQNFTFNESISFTIRCEDQQEIDYYWERLTKEGKEVQCGWCQDPYGVSWQVVPHNIQQLIFSSPNPAKATEALLKMKKIIIQDLEKA